MVLRAPVGRVSVYELDCPAQFWEVVGRVRHGCGGLDQKCVLASCDVEEVHRVAAFAGKFRETIVCRAAERTCAKCHRDCNQLANCESGRGVPKRRVCGIQSGHLWSSIGKRL